MSDHSDSRSSNHVLKFLIKIILVVWKVHAALFAVLRILMLTSVDRLERAFFDDLRHDLVCLILASWVASCWLLLLQSWGQTEVAKAAHLTGAFAAATVHPDDRRRVVTHHSVRVVVDCLDVQEAVLLAAATARTGADIAKPLGIFVLRQGELWKIQI